MRSTHIGAALLLAGALCLGGCRGADGPPPIAAGSPCAVCGMAIADLHVACERQAGERWRAYDSIECLLRDPATGADGPAYLADYDTQALHAADSMWVVHGHFPTPMGGGYAAFLRRADAEQLAVQTRGEVDRLPAFAAAEQRAGR